MRYCNTFRHQKLRLNVPALGISSRLYLHNRPPSGSKTERRENIYTFPNLLTAGRIALCPFIGWSILNAEYHQAVALVALAGISDFADGYLARRFNVRTVLGSILDPAADKALMTTLTVTLTINHLVPLPLAILIVGRDVLLGVMALYHRYRSLPGPKTFQRYWDVSIPSAGVEPTAVSKWNTLFQLCLMALTTISPIVEHDLTLVLTSLQWLTASTTLYSGMQYMLSQGAIKYLS